MNEALILPIDHQHRERRQVIPTHICSRGFELLGLLLEGLDSDSSLLQLSLSFLQGFPESTDDDPRMNSVLSYSEPRGQTEWMGESKDGWNGMMDE